jgi:hypothetical protein
VPSCFNCASLFLSAAVKGASTSATGFTNTYFGFGGAGFVAFAFGFVATGVVRFVLLRRRSYVALAFLFSCFFSTGGGFGNSSFFTGSGAV